MRAAFSRRYFYFSLPLFPGGGSMQASLPAGFSHL